MAQLVPSREPLRVAVLEDDSLVQSTLKILLNGQILSFHPHLDAFLRSPDADQTWDIVLVDLAHSDDPQGERSVSLIPELRARQRDAELVVQSGMSHIEVMRACVQNGASRFILKNHLADEIPPLLERTLEIRDQRLLLDKSLIGECSHMRRLKDDLLSLRLENRIDVLIEGETGTGKELCARALHAGGPFIAVNVSAIPPELFEAEFFGAEKGAFTGAVQGRIGHFESAQSGTLFLDEVHTLAPSHQAKLLRVLETRTFNRVGSSQERRFQARVVSASNRNLREAVLRNQFREDLYYRVAPLTLHVAPLRVRGDDVLLLAQNFLREMDTTRGTSISKAGQSFLKEGYDWPGNVRELRNLMKTLVLKSPIPILDAPELKEALGLRDGDQEFILTAPANASGFGVDWNQSFDENVERLERHILTEVLGKNKTSAAREKLGLAKSRFYEKIKQYGLLKS